MIRHLLRVLLLPTAAVMACGGLFCSPNVPVVQTGEAIAIGATELDDGQMEIIMEVQILYDGPSEAFSWVLPVPTLPEIGVGSEVMFQRLFDLTRPTFTFTVDGSLSETCGSGLNLPDDCEFFVFEDVEGGSQSPTEAIILEQGSVGPFDFVILESGSADPDSAFRWLETNGFDQPDESKSLLNYYADMDMKFVALRLSKNSDAGDIRPLTMKYILDATPDKPFGCVPIQLTRVAAEDQMPVQVYAFANLKDSVTARAVPVNYFEVELDHRMANWLGCQGRDACFINDLRSRFRDATAAIGSKAFHTEFAGPIDAVKDQIGLVDLDLDVLSRSKTLLEFLDAMADANVPDMTLAHTIVQNYVPLLFARDKSISSTCNPMTTVYNPLNRFMMTRCVPLLDATGFDPVAMAQDLKEQIVDPSIEAEAWVESYSYMTRLYGEFATPTDMDKDPFFVFDTTLPDVTFDIRATGVPECRDPALPAPSIEETKNETSIKPEFGEFQDPPTFMRIDVEGDAYGPFTQPVSLSCSQYFATGDPIFDEGTEPPSTLGDVELVARSFGGEPLRRLATIATNNPGIPASFDAVALDEAVVAMDARVPSQVVPDTENVAVQNSNEQCGSPTEQLFTLDFDSLPNGDAIAPGTPTFDQWKENGIKRIIGRRRNADGNYDAGKYWGRLFDSSNPTSRDRDLGSPNQNCPGCTIATCPGVSRKNGRGFLIANSTNCVPQFNVLILHGADASDEPHDNRYGGHLTFVFDTSLVTRVVSIELMDLENTKGLRIRQLSTDSVMENQKVEPLGDNTVQEVSLKTDLPDPVARVRVDLGGSGAVTKVKYCIQLDARRFLRETYK